MTVYEVDKSTLLLKSHLCNLDCRVKKQGGNLYFVYLGDDVKVSDVERIVEGITDVDMDGVKITTPFYIDGYDADERALRVISAILKK